MVVSLYPTYENTSMALFGALMLKSPLGLVVVPTFEFCTCTATPDNGWLFSPVTLPVIAMVFCAFASYCALNKIASSPRVRTLIHHMPLGTCLFIEEMFR